MKIALLGYGKMGREVEKAALERHHEIALLIDIANIQDLNEENLSAVDVAIDFSTPDAAYQNIITCFRADTPIVCGTTGWIDKFDTVKKMCEEKGHAFFYAPNFSLGVNILFNLNKYLARIMNNFNDYDCSIEEIHHIHKLDAPSGTAIALSRDIIECIDRKTQWEQNPVSDSSSVRITAIREDEVPGTHIVSYDSAVDSIEIKHTAKNRKGLALGAILAAEFLAGKKGYYTMSDLLGF
ncbi:MAG: 4-hydroxy-tetrahydrodipicolinate reductase [Bacteroidales bacterium]|nr:4-hydroxy-tetrahydrodipicolinate reductase [Bacteroidales bacterium]MBN2764027.1 4-hydroxy-tetrahydrodipicolinate reductase [Bacteroidales bacterium]